jgi:large subunit ribosomal protein L24
MAARKSTAPARRPAVKIRRDDEVVVISGKDRGKTGKVLRVDPVKQKVFVEGLNLVKRHQRPTQLPNATGSQLGGVIEKEGPIHISNVMLIDPKDKKRTRVGVSREGGTRTRVARRSGTKLD